MAEYWDSKGNIHHDNEFQGPSSTAVRTSSQLLSTVGGSYALAKGNPQVGTLILLGQTISTMGNRLSRPGIDLIKKYGSDNLIDSILDNNRVFGQWMNKESRERLWKDALALSQDVYVINGHSFNFFHTYSFTRLKKGWSLIDQNLKLEQFPSSVQNFCNQVKSISNNLNNNISGLGSMVCISQYTDNTYVVAYVFEGTNTNGMQDAGADLEQGLKGNTPQYAQALHNAKLIVSKFNNTIRNVAKLYFFGHSLGGGLANAAALSTGFPAITFNAASLHPDFISQYENNYQKRNLLGIYVDGEVLSSKASGYVGLPKTGDRYKVVLTKDAYTNNKLSTKKLEEKVFLIPSIRKHMLEPLCQLYQLQYQDYWNKKEKI